MLVYGGTSTLCKYGCSVYPQQKVVMSSNNSNIIIGGGGGGRIRPRCFTRVASRVTIGFVTKTAAAAIIMFSAVGTNTSTNTNTNAIAIEVRFEQITQSEETLSDIPQMLSGDCSSSPQECKKARIQRPKSRKAESCTIKCVTTCIRGGVGSPGEGPLNVRRPLVVFKQGFRSRQYCLVECSDICNLIGDGDDGP